MQITIHKMLEILKRWPIARAMYISAIFHSICFNYLSIIRIPGCDKPTTWNNKRGCVCVRNMHICVACLLCYVYLFVFTIYKMDFNPITAYSPVHWLGLEDRNYLPIRVNINRKCINDIKFRLWNLMLFAEKAHSNGIDLNSVGSK